MKNLDKPGFVRLLKKPYKALVRLLQKPSKDAGFASGIFNSKSEREVCMFIIFIKY